MREIKEGRDAFKSGIKELEQSGYIRRETIKNSKGQVAGVKIIFINPESIDKAKNPLSENPIVEKPTKEKPASENPTSNNTYLKNNDFINMNKGINKDVIFVSETFSLDFSNKYIAPLQNISHERKTAFEKWIVKENGGEYITARSIPRLYLTFEKDGLLR